MEQDFTWDPLKAELNFAKHGVRFTTATQAFTDPHAVYELERYVDGEERWQTIGMVDGKLLLLVVNTTWIDNEIEVIRIISARKAEKHERAKYEKQFGPLQH